MNIHAAGCCCHPVVKIGIKKGTSETTTRTDPFQWFILLPFCDVVLLLLLPLYSLRLSSYLLVLRVRV